MPQTITLNAAIIGSDREFRRSNPLNLRSVKGNNWRGIIADDNGYCVFDNPLNGFRAAGIVLFRYWRDHGLKTIPEIVARFAPGADGNNEGTYVTNLCNWLDSTPEEELDLSSPRNLAALMAAMCRQEQGRRPESATVQRAAAMAIEYVNNQGGK